MNGVAQRFSKIKMAAEDPGAITGAASAQVFLAHEARGHTFEDGEIDRPVMVQVRQSDDAQ